MDQTSKRLVSPVIVCLGLAIGANLHAANSQTPNPDLVPVPIIYTPTPVDTTSAEPTESESMPNTPKPVHSSRQASDSGMVNFLEYLEICKPTSITMKKGLITYAILGRDKSTCKVVYEKPGVKSTCYLSSSEVTNMTTPAKMQQADKFDRGLSSPESAFSPASLSDCSSESMPLSAQQEVGLSENMLDYYRAQLQWVKINIPKFDSMRLVNKNSCDSYKDRNIKLANLTNALGQGYNMTPDKRGFKRVAWKCGGDAYVFNFDVNRRLEKTTIYPVKKAREALSQNQQLTPKRNNKTNRTININR